MPFKIKKRLLEEQSLFFARMKAQIMDLRTT